MKQAIVSYDKCKACTKCVARKSCPTKALFQIDSEEPVSIDMMLCHGCGKCILKCPNRAIEIKDL